MNEWGEERGSQGCSLGLWLSSTWEERPTWQEPCPMVVFSFRAIGVGTASANPWHFWASKAEVSRPGDLRT